MRLRGDYQSQVDPMWEQQVREQLNEEEFTKWAQSVEDILMTNIHEIWLSNEKASGAIADFLSIPNDSTYKIVYNATSSNIKHKLDKVKRKELLPDVSVLEYLFC